MGARGRRVVLLALLLVVGCVPTPSRAAPVPAPAVPSARVAAVPDLDLGPALSVKGDVAVWIALPGRPRPLYERDADERMVAASLYKLALLLEVERRVDARELTYQDQIEITAEDVTVDGSNVLPGTTLTIDDALEQMITYSDNGTATAFWRALGPAANATLERAGIAGMHVATGRNDDHTVTAQSLGTYLAMLAQRALVSPAASARMYERLLRQHINDRIPRSLPEGTRVAHKTGDLIDHIHDAGIVETAAGPLVVVVLTRGVADAEARSLIAEVASLAYEHVARAMAESASSAPQATGTLTLVAPDGDARAASGVALAVGALALGGFLLLRVRRRRRGARSRSMAVRSRRR